MSQTARQPGPALRDPRYQDLCGFFRTVPKGADWAPAFGDWVVRAPGEGLGIITRLDVQGAETVLSIVPSDESGAYTLDRRDAIWLPTLDQLRSMMLDAFGTCGVFTSGFNGRAWWFTGNIMGMSVTNVVPLAEGGSAEEAALNALLMTSQR